MLFSANENLTAANKRIIKNFNNKLFVGGAILLVILIIVMSTITGISLYIDLGFAFIFSCLLYVPTSVKVIRKLRRFVSSVEINGDMVRVKGNEIRSFLGFINFAPEEISFALKMDTSFETESNFKIVDYNAEVYSFDFEGKKYYLVEAFFDNFASIKKLLNINK